VPIGGKEVSLWVELEGYAPRGGKTYHVSYSGTTDITGPNTVTVPENSDRTSFKVTVGPCSLAPACEVVASMGLKDTLIVKP
jgi:hypothetical protein